MTWTIKSILDWTTEYFSKDGIEWPHLEAEILLSYALGIKRIELYIQHERVLAENELTKYKALLLRRKKHEPIAYIVGTQPFMSLEFEVNPSVLIPRPETEKLVETALDLAPQIPLSEGQPLQILDIGTGSGAIAVSLAKYLPNAQITAIDISHAALEVAKRNAEKFGAADRITFLQQDFLVSHPSPPNSQLSSLTSSPISAPAPSPSAYPLTLNAYHFIISNPPYILTCELSRLMPDVRNFEPIAALDGGEDGLKYIRALIEHAPSMLAVGGCLVMEIGFDQKEKVLKLVNALPAGRGFKEAKVIPDQFGKDRVLVGKKVL